METLRYDYVSPKALAQRLPSQRLRQQYKYANEITIGGESMLAAVVAIGASVRQ